MTAGFYKLFKLCDFITHFALFAIDSFALVFVVLAFFRLVFIFRGVRFVVIVILEVLSEVAATHHFAQHLHAVFFRRLTYQVLLFHSEHIVENPHHGTSDSFHAEIA